MATFLNEAPFANYGVAYADAILDLAGGYAERDLSGLAKDCAPTYGASKGVGATTYVDGERSIAIDRDSYETKEFTTLLQAYIKDPTEEKRNAIYANPVYAYHLRQRTKFTPYTTEISVMFNDEAEFFARCAQRTGDVKTAGNTLIHNRNKGFMAALTAESVMRQTTDGYGISSDNDTADTLPDSAKTSTAEKSLTIDLLLELEGKVSLISDWTGPKIMLMHPLMKTKFLRAEVEHLANVLFLPGNNVLKAADCGPLLAGFAAMTSQYCPVNKVIIFEPNATVGRVHWFDKVRGGSSRDTKWQNELLYQTCEQYKRIDDNRVHVVTFTDADLVAEAEKFKVGALTGSVVYSA